MNSTSRGALKPASRSFAKAITFSGVTESSARPRRGPKTPSCWVSGFTPACTSAAGHARLRDSVPSPMSRLMTSRISVGLGLKPMKLACMRPLAVQ